MTTLTIFVAWFAFGYSVADIISGAVSNYRVNKLVKEMEELHNSRND